jgi:hypothetical protein
MPIANYLMLGIASAGLAIEVMVFLLPWSRRSVREHRARDRVLLTVADLRFIVDNRSRVTPYQAE